MNTELFNFVIDSMSNAIELIDDKIDPVENPDEYPVRKDLDKAMRLFYDWYQTAWEFPDKAVKIKP